MSKRYFSLFPLIKKADLINQRRTQYFSYIFLLIKSLCIVFIINLFGCSLFSNNRVPTDINDIKMDINRIKESQEKNRLLLETDLYKKNQDNTAQFESMRNSLISVKQELEKTQDEIKLLRGKIEEFEFKLSQKEILSSSSSPLQGEIRARQPGTTTIKKPKIPSYQDSQKSTDSLLMQPPTQDVLPIQQTPSNVLSQDIIQPTTKPDESEYSSTKEITKSTTPAMIPNNEEVEMTFQSARSFFLSGRYDESIKTLNNFIARYSDFNRLPDFLFMLGESYFYKDDFENSQKVFEKIYFEHKISPKTPDSLAFLAEISKKKGNTEKAIFYYEKIISEYKAYGELDRIKEELKMLKQEK